MLSFVAPNAADLRPAARPDEIDRHFMALALELARAAAGLASPNPTVGCVLVSPGPRPRIIGEGAHLYANRDHAEIVALQQAVALGHDLRGATAFVTLEPCAHHGRTGPCAVALVQAGIARCVVATTDPNPLVSGRGLDILHDAGVTVTLGPGAAEARALNLAFAHFIQHRRPFVILKSALSVDGHLAPPPHTRTAATPVWLTGPLARAEVHRLRHSADAILTGIGTVLADDPTLTDRSGLARRRPLLRVVLDPQLRTPPTSQLLRSPATAPEPDLLLLCAESALADPILHARRQALERVAPDRIEILAIPASAGSAGANRSPSRPADLGPPPDLRRPTHLGLPPDLRRPTHLSLPATLDLLAERQCLSLLVEAGATLNAAFLHQDLVDRAVLFFSQRELGIDAVPFAAGGPSPFLLRQRLTGVTERELGPDTEITGLLHNPWPIHP